MTIQSHGSGDEAQIRTLIEHWASALRAKDVDGVMSAHAPDTLSFDLAPPLKNGFEARRQGLEAWFPAFNGPIGYAIGKDLVISVSGDVAFSHSLNRMAGKRYSGEEFDIWVRATMGFRKVGGTWKVAHTHTSVPFYMDGSFKAAVDLEP